jgi:DNA-binding LacI/PurR family transcriptional regulator
MTVRLLDIARHAKVSLGVVSAVVNRSKSNTVVSPDTERRILSIAKELGYVPNAAARAVRQRRFQRIAGVVVQYGPRGTTYSPNSGYFDTAADKLAEFGYSLVFEPMHIKAFSDEFIEPPRLFSELAVDGVLAIPMTGYVPQQLDEKLLKLGAPVVWLNRKSDGNPNWVYCDEAAGARALVRHLAELGHRRIGYLGFKGLHYSAADRYEAVLGEMKRAGLDTSNIVMAEREASMVDEADRLLDVDPPVTAVICYQRRGYDALLHMAANRGILVPQELSIAYFASAWEVIGADMPKTLVETPEPLMAQVGVQILLNLIDGKETADIAQAVPGRLRLGMTTDKPMAEREDSD